ncbi:MAG: efflux RND transporter periplasmic adaptor subunit [Anaerolineae bacterium]|nr:efflux RND transporter periplasmic adaptor subunit [Anaerolineae bacterium]
MTRKNLWLRITFFLLASILAISPMACSLIGGNEETTSSSNEDATPTPIPTSIVPTNPTYTVQRGDVIRRLQFSARVAPVLEEELFFKMGGYVDTVYIRRGDEVKDGDLLAELEVTDLKNQITQQQAELTAVQMDYDRRMAEAKADVRTQELQLAKLRASVSEAQLINARINLERARQSLDDAQVEYNESLDRNWELPEVRKGYARAVQNAQWSVEMAEANYEDALRAQQRTGYDIELAQQSLDLASMRLQEVEIGLDITRTVLSLQRLNDQLSDARIVAPFDGVILQITIIDGKQVAGYDPQITLADPSELEVSADLMDTEMSELTEGMMIMAEFVNRPGREFEGQIRRLPYPYGSTKPADGVDDEDQSTRITLFDVDQEEIGFDVGDRLRITVELEWAEGTLWLPPQAVRTFEGRNFVVIQEEGGQRRMDVRLGIRSDEALEILEGLEEGQVVIAP